MNAKGILNEKEKERPKLESWLEANKYKVGLVLILILLTGVMVYGAENHNWSPSLDDSQSADAIASIKKEMEDIRQENAVLKDKLGEVNAKIEEIKNVFAVNQGDTNQIDRGTGGKVTGASASSQIETQTTQTPTSPQPSGMININTAPASELEKLPGVGPVRAGDIIEYREANNGFKTSEEIMNIRGIGEKTFEKMKGMITVK